MGESMAASSSFKVILDCIVNDFLWLLEEPGFHLSGSSFDRRYDLCMVEISGDGLVMRFRNDRDRVYVEFCGGPDWVEGFTVDLLADHLGYGSLSAVLSGIESIDFVVNELDRIKKLISGQNEKRLESLMKKLKSRRAKRIFK